MLLCIVCCVNCSSVLNCSTTSVCVPQVWANCLCGSGRVNPMYSNSRATSTTWPPCRTLLTDSTLPPEGMMGRWGSTKAPFSVLPPWVMWASTLLSWKGCYRAALVLENYCCCLSFNRFITTFNVISYTYLSWLLGSEFLFLILKRKQNQQTCWLPRNNAEDPFLGHGQL